MELIEIEKALKEIREICKSNIHCSDCPFRTYGGGSCYIQNRPDGWEFKDDPSDKIGRLFY